MPTLAHDWPDRDFSPEARDYLVVEVRQRIQEQLARISAQDIKTATIFTISVLLISASGLIGDTRLFASLSGSLLGLALVASLSPGCSPGCRTERGKSLPVWMCPRWRRITPTRLSMS